MSAQESHARSGAVEVQRQPQVLEEMNGLGSLIMQHEEIVAEIEKRLHGILRVVPQDASANSGPTQTMTPLAGEIRAAADRLAALRDHYKSILQRLEI